MPGGGLVNHEFLNRVYLANTFSPVILLGEGVFHQVHGGVSTNVKQSAHPLARFKDELAEIHGADFEWAKAPKVHYFGTMTPSAHRFTARPKP